MSENATVLFARLVDNNIPNNISFNDYDIYRAETNSSDDFRPTGNNTLPWSDSDDLQEEEDYGILGYYYPSGYSHLRIILTSFFVTVIMILIVVGNMLVCIAIATEKSLKTVQNWFIASLAVSDFLVGLIVMPFSLAKEVMGYWIFGDIWCEVHSALDVFLCTASINSLCLISLDRYWSVTHAVEYLKKRTPNRSMAMICFVWVISAVISLPPLVGWKKPERPSPYPTCLLSDDVGYVLYSAFGSFYIPAFVMVFVYCRIFVAARSRARRHIKKKQKAEMASATEFTNDPIKDKSTTTTTCTSFSNPSPTDRTKDFECFSPSYDTSRTSAAATTETNGTNKQIPIVVAAPAPEIIIEASSEGREPSTSSKQATSGLQPETTVETETNRPSEERRLLRPDMDSFSCASSPEQNEEECTPVPVKTRGRKPSMLRAPKFLKSPFGSTLSLNEMAQSEEDVSDLNSDSRRRKKKPKVQYLIEELPKKHVPTEAEKHKRRIAKARERRATLILGLIMASFILAWLPFFVLYVLEALCKRCQIGETGFAIAFWLGYCNSALNPIIYTIFNRDFRKAFKKILFK